jgi:hypothetical protein
MSKVGTALFLGEEIRSPEHMELKRLVYNREYDGTVG